jgi:hypothetical protein
LYEHQGRYSSGALLGVRGRVRLGEELKEGRVDAKGSGLFESGLPENVHRRKSAIYLGDVGKVFRNQAHYLSLKVGPIELRSDAP